MSSERTPERTTDRRDEILAIAKEIFAENGVRQTTVRQIGARAGILSGSLYHHFSSKLDMVEAILRDFTAPVLERYRAIAESKDDGLTRVRRMAQLAISIIPEHHAALSMMLTDAPELAREARFRFLLDFDLEVEKHWVTAIEDGVRAGDIRADLDVAMTYRFARDAIRGAIRWYVPEGSRSLEDVTEQFTGILLGGISTR